MKLCSVWKTKHKSEIWNVECEILTQDRLTNDDWNMKY